MNSVENFVDFYKNIAVRYEIMEGEVVLYVLPYDTDRKHTARKSLAALYGDDHQQWPEDRIFDLLSYMFLEGYVVHAEFNSDLKYARSKVLKRYFSLRAEGKPADEIIAFVSAFFDTVLHHLLQKDVHEQTREKLPPAPDILKRTRRPSEGEDDANFHNR